MLDELASFTLESIAGVYFGDYATPEFMEDIRRYMPTITKSVFSIPIWFPWPLNKLPLFGFGKSMDARAAFSDVVRRVADDRRVALAAERSGGSSRTGGKSAGVLDALLEIQREQGGTFDDDFIVDNVSTNSLMLKLRGAVVFFVGRSVVHRQPCFIFFQ